MEQPIATLSCIPMRGTEKTFLTIIFGLEFAENDKRGKINHRIVARIFRFLSSICMMGGFGKAAQLDNARTNFLQDAHDAHRDANRGCTLFSSICMMLMGCFGKAAQLDNAPTNSSQGAHLFELGPFPVIVSPV